MLTQYKNIEQINNTTKSVSATRLPNLKSSLLSYDANERVTQVPQLVQQTNESRIELHVYSGDTWITGNHKIQVVQKIPEYRDKNTNNLIKLPSQPVAIDLYNEFDQLQLNAGNFRIVVNFFENLIGNYEQQFLKIDDISPDRTEVRLRAIDDTDPQFLEQIALYVNTVNQTTSTYYNSTWCESTWIGV
jgi:hypothetical protein